MRVKICVYMYVFVCVLLREGVCVWDLVGVGRGEAGLEGGSLQDLACVYVRVCV